jgi:hypothetical protein
MTLEVIVFDDAPPKPVTVQAGDYAYDGWEVARFAKRSGQIRVAVEDEHGRLFFHRPEQLVGRLT